MLLLNYQFLEEIFCAPDLHQLEVSTNKIYVIQSTICGHSGRKMCVGEQREKCFGPCSLPGPGACPAGTSKSGPPEAGHCSEEKGQLALAFLGSNVTYRLHFLSVAFFPSCQVATKALNIGRWGPSLPVTAKLFVRAP